MSEFQYDNQIYLVVVNQEEQYSIWPDYQEIPKGWKTINILGSKDECLEHIEKLWTDMRPLSLREMMDQ